MKTRDVSGLFYLKTNEKPSLSKSSSSNKSMLLRCCRNLTPKSLHMMVFHSILYALSLTFLFLMQKQSMGIQSESFLNGTLDVVVVSSGIYGGYCFLAFKRCCLREDVIDLFAQAAYYFHFFFLFGKSVAHFVLENPDAFSIDFESCLFWGAICLSWIFSYLLCNLVPSISSHQAREISAEEQLLPSSDTVSDGRKEGGANRATALKLLRLLYPEYLLILQAGVFLIIAAVSEALIPKYTSQVISEVIKAEEKLVPADSFLQPLKFLIISSFLNALSSSCRGSSFIMIGARVNRRLRQTVFERLLGQEIGFFDTTKTGELTSHMTQDVTKVTDQVTLNINVFTRTLIQILTTLFFMFAMSVRLTLVAFVSVPVSVVISKKYGDFIKRLTKEIQNGLASANSVAQESLSSMSTVRSFAAESLEADRFRGKLTTVYGLQKKHAMVYIPYLSTIYLLPNLVACLVLWYGGRLAHFKLINSGGLIAFVLYLQVLTYSLSIFGDFYTTVLQALGAADKVFELMERKPKMVRDPPVPIELDGFGSLQGKIEFKDISFSYPARETHQVLHSLSLCVPAGNVCALVGPSGGGKSTCIGLIQRWYEAAEGEVTLDGIPLSKFGHRNLHSYISIVGQEPVLFGRTIKENIVFGLLNPGEPIPEDLHKEVVEASKLASAHDFISSLPAGYDTEVGEKGVQLSGGQKQRVAIARALVRRPKVLLLDEATSALDAESERLVQSSIDRMISQGDMTVIIVAHRLSTVRNADQISVISEGKVSEIGTHAELIARKKLYFELVRNQLEAGAAAEGDNSRGEMS